MPLDGIAQLELSDWEHAFGELCQLVFTKETDILQCIQICKSLQDWLTMAAHSQMWKGITFCLRSGELKNPVEGLELTTVSCASPYQEAEVFVPEG